MENVSSCISGKMIKVIAIFGTLFVGVFVAWRVIMNLAFIPQDSGIFHNAVEIIKMHIIGILFDLRVIGIGILPLLVFLLLFFVIESILESWESKTKSATTPPYCENT